MLRRHLLKLFPQVYQTTVTLAQRHEAFKAAAGQTSITLGLLPNSAFLTLVYRNGILLVERNKIPADNGDYVKFYSTITFNIPCTADDIIQVLYWA